MAKVGWAQAFSQTVYNEPELADFCSTCGNLLHFKIANKQIECTLCNNKFHTSSIYQSILLFNLFRDKNQENKGVTIL
jgi:LSD1 subclass zinc finger protein